MNNRRRVEKSTNKGWVEVEFIDLKTGDMFRMFEPDGEPVDNGNIFEAIENAFSNKEGIGEIQISNIKTRIAEETD